MLISRNRLILLTYLFVFRPNPTEEGRLCQQQVSYYCCSGLQGTTNFNFSLSIHLWGGDKLNFSNFICFFVLGVINFSLKTFPSCDPCLLFTQVVLTIVLVLACCVACRCWLVYSLLAVCVKSKWKASAKSSAVGCYL